MKATVLVRPKQGILDPQGQAVETALEHLGFAVAGARVGKVVDLEAVFDLSSYTRHVDTVFARLHSIAVKEEPVHA